MGYRDKGFFRRKFPRRWFKRAVGVLSHGVYVIGKSTEIGEGGMSVVTDQPFEAGSEIVVNFRILGGDFVSLRAEVRSVRPIEDGHLHGLSFKNVAFTHKRQIRSFVSSRGSTESLVN